ncbi:hypothetical protein ACM64Y_08530 [Novispirillum sp. DQ9]|uniref:hypothetical protein n=1 Tax=Novispirillum sp. DQ9 TaxID=3398612 RepID=UPI003C7D0A72
MRTLDVGEEASHPISSRIFWVHTRILLRPGQRYVMTAEGQWVDWFVPSTAAGSDLTLKRDKWRVPSARLFSLIGAIGERPDTAFVIGERWDGSVPEEGELCCFANDLPRMYWNNWGSVTLRVRRTA